MRSPGQLWWRWVWRSVAGIFVSLAVFALALVVIMVSVLLLVNIFGTDPDGFHYKLPLPMAFMASLCASMIFMYFIASFQAPVLKESLGYSNKSRWSIVTSILFAAAIATIFVELLITHPEALSSSLGTGRTYEHYGSLHWNLLRVGVVGVIFLSTQWYLVLSHHATGFRSWLAWNLLGLFTITIFSEVLKGFLDPSGSGTALINVTVYPLILIGFSGIGVVKLQALAMPENAEDTVAEAFT